MTPLTRLPALLRSALLGSLIMASLYSCGVIEPEEETINPIEGAWKSGCELTPNSVRIQKYYTFDNYRFTYQTSDYADELCEFPIWTLEAQGDYTRGDVVTASEFDSTYQATGTTNDGEKLTLTVDYVGLTYFDTATTEHANWNGDHLGCGTTGYIEGRTMDITSCYKNSVDLYANGLYVINPDSILYFGYFDSILSDNIYLNTWPFALQ